MSLLTYRYLDKLILLIVPHDHESSVFKNLEDHNFDVKRLTLWRVPSKIKTLFLIQVHMKSLHDKTLTHSYVLLHLFSYPFCQLLFCILVLYFIPILLQLSPVLNVSSLLFSKIIKMSVFMLHFIEISIILFHF